MRHRPPTGPPPAARATRVALGLGGNVGDPLYWFRTAARVFARHLRSLAAAPLYCTDPVSPVLQPAYLNTVLAGTTTTSPEDLLAIAKALERAAGRPIAPLRDHPRPLDIDLLVYGDEVRTTAELELPHPRLRERRFALQPLADLDPEWRLPPDGRTSSEVLKDLKEVPRVERLGDWWPPPIRKRLSG
ncbi:MAG TPA: 2-amino-4-hydroxy-6-hydroxymethyldihydropteridine diphosphokinase [Thermoanaerobaculia bacterium]|nr:2-amino-4-hydroxy-6-hydroxymethyldihydropteridine diphosphokinase [Thermoanaerobaculia bacterium]